MIRATALAAVMATGLALAGPARPAEAQTHTADSARVEGGLLRKSDWVLGAMFLGSFAMTEVEGLDEVDRLVDPSPEGGDAFHRALGRNYGRLPVISALQVATILAGAAAGSEKVALVGLRGLESLLLNTSLTTAFKIGFGRSRPYTGRDEDFYEPFSWQRDQWSFPSGHTSNVFAIATTLTLELGDELPWIPYVAYSLAGWTGLTRMLDEKHYFTDVLAGAAVGMFSARVIHRVHERPETASPARRPGSGMTPRLLLSTGDALLVGVSFSFN